MAEKHPGSLPQDPSDPVLDQLKELSTDHTAVSPDAAAAAVVVSPGKM